MPTGVYVRTEQHNRNVSLAKKGKKLGKQSEEHRSKRSLLMMGERNPCFGRTGDKNPMFGRHQLVTEERKIRISTRMKKLWQDSEYVRKVLGALLESPTSYEQGVIDIVVNNDLPFRYVGNGQLIVGYVNPDFVDTLGLNPPLVIEPHNLIHHPSNYEEVRHLSLQIPRQNVLFFSDPDFERTEGWEQRILNKILGFLKFHSVQVKMVA